MVWMAIDRTKKANVKSSKQITRKKTTHGKQIEVEYDRDKEKWLKNKHKSRNAVYLDL